VNRKASKLPSRGANEPWGMSKERPLELEPPAVPTANKQEQQAGRYNVRRRESRSRGGGSLTGVRSSVHRWHRAIRP